MEWLPKQAVLWVQKALGFWLADLGRWASSAEALPLAFSDGSFESKLDVHHRSMPRIGNPLRIGDQSELALASRVPAGGAKAKAHAQVE
jgi:hypothetical protein